jgi:ribokinase
LCSQNTATRRWHRLIPAGEQSILTGAASYKKYPTVSGETMNRKPKITIVGSFNTDLMVRTVRMPQPGETILGGPFVTGPGGKGANQAVAAARLGADVTIVVKLGQDYYGDLAYENLRKEGIRTDGVIRTSDTHTGAAFILVDDQGENMIVVAGGANNQLLPEDIEKIRPAILDADIVVMQLEIPVQTVLYTAKLAAEAGVKVQLNPAPGQTLPSELLERVDYMTPNETETHLVTGMAIDNPQNAQLAAQSLLKSGVKAVVMTLGAKGALAVTEGEVSLVPGRKVNVLDTTGAGDAFNGALAVALTEGKPLAAAVEFANCAAALQVTRQGTAPAMPYRAEVEELLNHAQELKD